MLYWPKSSIKSLRYVGNSIVGDKVYGDEESYGNYLADLFTSFFTCIQFNLSIKKWWSDDCADYLRILMICF